MVVPTLDQDFVQAFRTGTLTEAQAVAFAHRVPLELSVAIVVLIQKNDGMPVPNDFE